MHSIAPALASVAQVLEGQAIKLGAQNMHPEKNGAYTGEVSAEMLRTLYVTHVILGHSERRTYFGETDAFINKKVLAALKNQLKPILQQIATMRQALVRAKAKQYGLDMNVEADRLMAAEEVLAEMAQTRPELGWVQRAIAAIRRFLRAHGVSLGLSDNDIIADYILPARGWVERGRAAAPSIMRGPAMAADRKSVV